MCVHGDTGVDQKGMSTGRAQHTDRERRGVPQLTASRREFEYSGAEGCAMESNHRLQIMSVEVHIQKHSLISFFLYSLHPDPGKLAVCN